MYCEVNGRVTSDVLQSGLLAEDLTKIRPLVDVPEDRVETLLRQVHADRQEPKPMQKPPRHVEAPTMQIDLIDVKEPRWDRARRIGRDALWTQLRHRREAARPGLRNRVGVVDEGVSDEHGRVMNEKASAFVQGMEHHARVKYNAGPRHRTQSTRVKHEEGAALPLHRDHAEVRQSHINPEHRAGEPTEIEHEEKALHFDGHLVPPRRD
mmetsp:Transcript_95653/g.270711  ORF Transcript_95653/g.270711 Transcript_95653/m.270711 type:complete len:209 (-) Transcript_95653:355-981(-)